MVSFCRQMFTKQPMKVPSFRSATRAILTLNCIGTPKSVSRDDGVIRINNVQDDLILPLINVQKQWDIYVMLRYSELAANFNNLWEFEISILLCFMPKIKFRTKNCISPTEYISLWFNDNINELSYLAYKLAFHHCSQQHVVSIPNMTKMFK